MKTLARATALLVFLLLASGLQAQVPLWYTQADSLKATIIKQWMTFGKITMNRDGGIYSSGILLPFSIPGTSTTKYRFDNDSSYFHGDTAEFNHFIGDGAGITSVLHSSDTSTLLAKQWWVKDQIRDSLVEYTPRTIQAADSTYKAAELLKRILYSDTTSSIAKQWWVKDQIKDSLAEYVLRANGTLTGTTSAAAIVPSGTSGQMGWFTKTGGRVSTINATDTVNARSGIIWSDSGQVYRNTGFQSLNYNVGGGLAYDSTQKAVTGLLKNLIVGNGGTLLNRIGTNPVDGVGNDVMKFEWDGWRNGWYNTFVGVNAGLLNTTGNENTFIGMEAGENNLNGDQNTFVGIWAGWINTSGYHNTFLGAGAGKGNTTGYYNVYIGTDCANQATGSNNTVVGTSAGSNMQSSYNNTFLGLNAGFSDSTGHDNVHIGYLSGYLTSGSTIHNTAIGSLTLEYNQGNDNTVIGYNAGISNITGYENTYIGVYSGQTGVGAYRNSLLGYGSGTHLTSGYQNVLIGHSAGAYDSTGRDNVFIGYTAGNKIGTGLANVGIGSNALANSRADENTAIGYQALLANTTGTLNTAIGEKTLASNNTGNNNVALGDYSLYALVGNYHNNIAIGHAAARYQADGTTALTTPSQSIYIGSGVRGFSNSDANSIVIGYNAIGAGQNTTVIGNASTTTTYIKGSLVDSTSVVTTGFVSTTDVRASDSVAAVTGAFSGSVSAPNIGTMAAADSTKWVNKRDSTAATGYYTNEKARVDTVNRNALLALKTNLAGETQWTTLKVAADDVRAGAAAWNALADLGFTGAANATYEIEGCIFVQSATVTVGVNVAFNCAGGTLSGIMESTSSATAYTAKVIATTTDSSASVHAGVVNLYYPQRFRVIWVVDGSDRAFAMQWRKEQVTGTMNQTVSQGSWIRYRIIK